jgi:two-component system LytT family sensor kinase
LDLINKMDPKTGKKWLFDLLLWAGLYLVWIFVFQNRTLNFSRTLGIELCYLVFIALNFYINIYFSIPKFLNQGRYFLFVSVSLFTVLATSGMRALVALFVNKYIYGVSLNQINIPNLYFSSVLNIFTWTVCLIAGKMILDKLKFQRYVETVEKEKVINELNFLRVQNNPHFLFNSLNSIYFQIDKKNKDARETLMCLSEMLRYQLYECSAEKIGIDKELDYLKNYIELQKIRLNKNYNIIFNVGPNVCGFTIPPLLILPLIENAFKYVSHFIDKVNEIKIYMSLDNNSFQCTIHNTIEKMPKMSDASEGGIGLKNLQRRLELLYPNRHEITFHNNQLEYVAKLTLKTNEN